MKIKSELFFIILLAAALLTSCGSKNELEEIQNDRESQTQTEAVETKPEVEATPAAGGKEGTLKISKWFADSIMNDVIASYEKANPNVDIIVDDYGENLEGYLLSLRTSMMAGSGPDIFTFHSVFAESLENAYVVDLNEMIAADSTFNMSDYYEGLLRAHTYNGKMFAIPLIGRFNMIGLNHKFADAIDQGFYANDYITLDQMLEYYSKLENKDGFYLLMDFDLFDLSYMDDYFDFAQNAASFGEYFIDRINLGLEARHPDKDYNMTIHPMPNAKTEKELSEEYVFYQVSPRDFIYYNLPRTEPYISYEDGPSENIYNDFKYLSLGEDKINCYTANALSLNANSANKELAWDFIKFAMSEKIYGDLSLVNQLTPSTTYINLNKNLDRAIIKVELVSYIEIYGGYDRTEYVLENHADDIEYATEKLIKLSDGLMYSPLYLLENIMGNAMQEIVEGRLSVEQAEAVIQSKVDLYLSE